MRSLQRDFSRNPIDFRAHEHRRKNPRRRVDEPYSTTRLVLRADVAWLIQIITERMPKPSGHGAGPPDRSLT
jgi:hypothetical protein